jgi:hypothetical protein
MQSVLAQSVVQTNILCIHHTIYLTMAKSRKLHPPRSDPVHVSPHPGEIIKIKLRRRFKSHAYLISSRLFAGTGRGTRGSLP